MVFNQKNQLKKIDKHHDNQIKKSLCFKWKKVKIFGFWIFDIIIK
jgi:hypothetical protein